MNPERNRIAGAIKFFMRGRGVSVHDIAVTLNLSDEAIYKRLQGKRDIAAHELLAIAERLEVEPGAFFRDPDDLVERASRWMFDTAPQPPESVQVAA